MSEKNKSRNASSITNQLKNMLAIIKDFHKNPEMISNRNVRILRKIHKILTEIINMLNNQKSDKL
ncbi:hypothetical protein [Bacteroides graminisolvens]|uniref:hypothetical protein n=1 Tax=Bacteroides graminisolvens TaxID=477666 RepID=UPI0029C8B86E|nr:hypothetical protein [Bacteroides graminisolvens]